jgi:hypothetical protein
VENPAIEERLIFLVAPPRSGSTLLSRMLGAHPAIAGGPEFHLLTPLAHLGYFERVDAAAYDPIISAEGIRELVARLPSGEADYVAACRAYADLIYGRYLESQPGKSHLLDKTPAYALSLPFLAQLYPRARYVVLTRTPPALLASQAISFFDGDFAEAERQSPVLERYVPAIARFLRERPVSLVHLRYEDLVAEPERELRRVFEHLELPFEASVIEYGQAEKATGTSAGRGLGDPIGVAQHSRPVTDSVERWVAEITCDPERTRIALECLDALDPRDVETWGYRVAELRVALQAGPSAGLPAPSRPPTSRYRLERKLLIFLRRHVRGGRLERLVRAIRTGCDLLLR